MRCGVDAGIISDTMFNPFNFHHDNKSAKGHIYYGPRQAVV